MEFPPAFSITFSLSVRAAVAFLDFRAFGSTSLGSLDFRAFGSRADEVVLAITSAAEVVTVGSATVSVTSGTATVAVGTVAVAVSVTCTAAAVAVANVASAVEGATGSGESGHVSSILMGEGDTSDSTTSLSSSARMQESSNRTCLAMGRPSISCIFFFRIPTVA
ncbi:hypothetical protein ACFX2C_026040 [Malus domestica]